MPVDPAEPNTPQDDQRSAGENTCPRCGGSGQLEGAACPTCEGTGEVMEGIGGG